MEFGRPGRGSNHITPLFMSTPVAGNMTREPKSESRVWVRATRLPSRSTTLKWVVQAGMATSASWPSVASRSA